MTRSDLPKPWLRAMSLIRVNLPSAYLAGGALRDLDNDRPVKDLDVFYTEAAGREVLEEALKGEFSYSTSCAGSYMEAADEVAISTTYASLSDCPDLNLIQLSPDFNPADILARMDFGLCQIGFDLLGVEATEAYLRDKANRTLTLTRAHSVQGAIRSLTRLDRLQTKYVGWSLVVPEEFEEIIAAAKFEKHQKEINA